MKNAFFLLLALNVAHAKELPETAVLKHALHSFAAERVQSGELAGIITEVGDNTGVLATSLAGFADMESKQPVAPDSLFWIASMSKPICGTAVMMAVEKDLIKISDPVSKYLPEFEKLTGPDGKPATITIAQCMSHTSGLQDFTPEENAATTDLAELTALVSSKPLKFEPGVKWSYCQTGISTAARVLEVVSGKSYPEYLSENLFQPLGMTDTTFYPTEAQLKRLALSYEKTDDGLKPVEIFILSGKSPTDTTRFPAAGGGLFSTAHDYGTFARMILNGGELNGKRYLKPGSIAEMTRSHTGDLEAGFVPGSNYGVGWIRVAEPVGVTTPLSAGSYGHGGAYGTQAWIDPLKNRYTIMMIQRAKMGNGDASETRRLFQQAAAK